MRMIFLLLLTAMLSGCRHPNVKQKPPKPMSDAAVEKALQRAMVKADRATERADRLGRQIDKDAEKLDRRVEKLSKKYDTE